MRQPSPYWRLAGVAVLVGLLLPGCGGGGPPTPVVAPPSVAQRQQQQTAPPPAPAPPKVEPRAAAATPKDETPELDPSVDPNDVFAVVEYEPPAYDVVGTEPRVKPSDLFAVTVPPPGENSTTFAVVERGVVASAGAPSPDFRLPSGYRPLPEAGYSAAGFPLRILCELDSSVMALVPSGPAVLGTNAGPSHAGPQISVFLDSYYIDVAEVTLAQFEKFRDARKALKRKIPVAPLNASAAGDFPAMGVYWGDARAYAYWLGKDLPTEAEWEKAARGEQGFQFVWGNDRPIWPRPRTPDQIEAVKSFRNDLSPYGVFDLAGNAREWCLDWYSDKAYEAARAEKSASLLQNWKGPRTPSEPNHRVVKGSGPDWAAWHRWGVNMRERPADIGFRCVLRLSDAAAREPLPEP